MSDSEVQSWWSITLLSLGGYILLSTLLLLYPELLSCCYTTKRHNLSHVIASSHRGGSAERPENTISAFRHAVDNCGYVFCTQMFVLIQVFTFADLALSRRVWCVCMSVCLYVCMSVFLS
jgi:hypothetical protein